ncbi:MAG: DNA polymerase III subunit delta [Elusimicrobiota bacterium]|jgi:DNA polymerase-3 subunit delta
METRYADVLKEWRAGKFRPVYLFVGEDVAAQTEAADLLKACLKPDSFNLAEFSGDIAVQTPAILSEALTLPVFSDRRLVVVNAPSLPAAAKAALVAYLKEPCASTTLALFSDERKVDPRDALVKAAAAAGAVCLFRALKEEDAAARLQAEAQKSGKRLTPDAAEALIAEAGTDWNILRQELEKAVLFSSGSAEVTAEHVAACLGYQKSADPFAMSRLIQARTLKPCLTHLRRFLLDGKPDDQAFRALAQINTSIQKQFRAKRLLQAGRSEAEIFSALRLHSYWDKDYLAGLKRVSAARLRSDMRACLDAEVSLKSRSWLSPAQEIERLVVELCAPKNA